MSSQESAVVILYFVSASSCFKTNVFASKLMCFVTVEFFFSGMYGLPKRNGKLKDISKFDASFFGVHPKQAHTMDPQLRLLLEVSYEAILDGGK